MLQRLLSISQKQNILPYHSKHSLQSFLVKMAGKTPRLTVCSFFIPCSSYGLCCILSCRLYLTPTMSLTNGFPKTLKVLPKKDQLWIRVCAMDHSPIRQTFAFGKSIGTAGRSILQNIVKCREYILSVDSFSKYKTKVIPNEVCIIRLYTIKYCIFRVI